MSSSQYRQGSEMLARILQEELLERIRKAGYAVTDRKAKMDPDTRPSGSNSDTQAGPYAVLSSEKLDRILQTTV